MGAKTEFEGCITHGPWGGSHGKEWVYRPDGFIRKISVSHGGVVDSIKFQTYWKGGTQSSFFGGNGGNRTDTICIDHPDEYLMSISGTVFFSVVTSISFVTNQNRYGPYGISFGTAFSYDGKGGVIVGFHGRADKYLTAIGVYVMPESLAYGLNSTYEVNFMPAVRFLVSITLLLLCSSMLRMSKPRDAGPWGAGGGKPWDDGVFPIIKQIRIHAGELKVIYALQFEYLGKDGESVLSQVHGAADGVTNIQLVNLDGKDEYLSGISGLYGPVAGYNGLEAIVSISFYTNKRILGPYGDPTGAGYANFSSTPYSPGKVVGFHGRINNGFLSAVGVHMEYF
ncbi:putative jacalin-like lectin domain-containing protein [Helianthus annuus]|uniref:Jacalin-like lectin domain-containing protein n=1 Tax=Helianthus annuus TaxID=4232 RepID=A0A251VFZ1_HELAN|nr:putative jacalin-like lectin domain-containing protein [Helianthus annuus]